MALLEAHALGDEKTLKLSAVKGSEGMCPSGPDKQEHSIANRRGVGGEGGGHSCTPPATPWLKVFIWKKRDYQPALSRRLREQSDALSGVCDKRGSCEYT